MLTAVVTMGAMGIVASFGLGIAARKFAVEIDPKIAEIDSFLPHANCGACGYAGCMGFAMAVAAGQAAVSGCAPGGASAAKKISAVMGVDAPEIPERMLARAYCLGGHNEAIEKFEYHGVQDCNAAILVAGGSKGCVYGCLGLASCVRACPFDAMYMRDKRLPLFIY